MSEKSLRQILEESIASGAADLPVFPRTASELRNALKDENRSLDAIAKQLAMDASLASQVLKAANSSFYAGMNKVATIKEAINRMGLARIVQIATLYLQKGLYASKHPATNRYLIKLWQHSAAVALGSEWLAKRLNFSTLAEEAFMAGLFHDIGELLLIRSLENVRAKYNDVNLPDELIHEIIEQQHTEKGTLLLKSWNLPDAYCAIAEMHHQPMSQETGTVELIVRIVDMVAYKLGISPRKQPQISVATSEEAQTLGITEITLAELEIALEDALAVSN
ncbi:MAG: metal-dependent phosphohydrolase [Methylomonas sp.]|nr:MAG: metal-dependent phosphohydrolase [Methylobacter sp.]PPD36201.1 MAG: metal-dependent phosphohydrolase [Methylomonas sp.]